jgi:hypothetical protein
LFIWVPKLFFSDSVRSLGGLSDAILQHDIFLGRNIAKSHSFSTGHKRLSLLGKQFQGWVCMPDRANRAKLMIFAPAKSLGETFACYSA